MIFLPYKIIVKLILYIKYLIIIIIKIIKIILFYQSNPLLHKDFFSAKNNIYQHIQFLHRYFLVVFLYYSNLQLVPIQFLVQRSQATYIFYQANQLNHLLFFFLTSSGTFAAFKAKFKFSGSTLFGLIVVILTINLLIYINNITYEFLDLNENSY